MEVQMTISVSVNQANHNLLQWVHRATTEGEAVMLTVGERPQAVLIGLHDWQTLQRVRANRAARLTALEQAQTFSEQLRATKPGDDVDAVTLLQTMREARDAELQGLY